ncbi:MAG: isoprenylcysteine carboxylmethyltransferase family protein [Ignavibacteriaceae bacterium]|jgi:protein-S-isoprenylcysteine O-methyltransferase Ste14
MTKPEISAAFFKYRSYTPIPFLVLSIAFINANIWSIFAGFLVALCGELIRLWGVSWAGSETRTTGDVGGTFLIVSGPFARVRNPLYVGNILMYVGLGLMSFALFPYLQIAGLIFFFIQYNFIVSEEENYLKKTFGQEFENYLKNVPRFFPRFTKYKAGNSVQPPFNFKAGLKSEKRSLQAFGIVAFTIILLWYLQRL